MSKAEDPLEEIECLVVYRAEGNSGLFEQWVVASELRRFLALDKDFFCWIEDSVNGGRFQHGRDFVNVPSKTTDISPDYHLSLDMALYMALNEYSGRGQQAARYINDRHRQWQFERTKQKTPGTKTIMNDKTQEMAVGESHLPIVEYRGQRVISMSMMDKAHGRPDGTARKRFNDHKNKLIEGEDYFVVNQPSEIRTLGLGRNDGSTPAS